MYFEKKTAKCPRCGDKAILTAWKPPRGINQDFREYKCSNLACRTVFYTDGIYQTGNKTH